MINYNKWSELNSDYLYFCGLNLLECVFLWVKFVGVWSRVFDGIVILIAKIMIWNIWVVSKLEI